MRSLVLGLVLLALSAGVAGAVCPGREVLFEDKFEALKPTWTDPTDPLKVENGQLILMPRSGTPNWTASNFSLYDDIDMCVTMTTVKAVDPVGAHGGIMFWYAGVNDFYSLEIAPNGKASVWRRQRGQWLMQVRWSDAGVNTGDGAVNELRVTTVGSNATFYVNGTRFQMLTGTPPEKGQLIGLIAWSPDTASARFAFDDVRVTRP